jgi:hypothetical protein
MAIQIKFFNHGWTRMDTDFCRKEASAYAEGFGGQGERKDS